MCWPCRVFGLQTDRWYTRWPSWHQQDPQEWVKLACKERNWCAGLDNFYVWSDHNDRFIVMMSESKSLAGLERSLKVRRGSQSGKWDHGVNHCHHYQQQTHTENPPDEKWWIKCGETDVTTPTVRSWQYSICLQNAFVWVVILGNTSISRVWEFIFMKLWLLKRLKIHINVCI